MKAKCQFFVRLLDLCFLGCLRDSKDVIVILFSQVHVYLFFHLLLFFIGGHSLNSKLSTFINKSKPLPHTYSLKTKILKLFPFTYNSLIQRKMNKSNSRGQILNKKDFNTNNSTTPSKKNNFNASHSSHNKTLNHLNQTETSYAASSGGVSYAELQIIMENVKAIKSKASQQIKNLENKNLKLEKQVKQLLENVDRYEHLEETIKLQKKNIEVKFQGELVEMRQLIEAQKQKNENLRELVEEKEQQIQQFSNKNRNLEKKINDSQNELHLQISRYEELTKSLLVTENSHELTVIEQKFGNLPSLLTAYNTLQANFKHSEREIDNLKNTIQEMKNQSITTQRIMETITSENKSLIQQLQNQSQRVRDLQDKIEGMEKGNTIIEQKQKEVYEELNKKMQSANMHHEKEVSDRQLQIQKIRAKLQFLEDTRREVEEREEASRQQAFFKSVVDEVCDEYEDYKNVIKRVQYLEKYRSQYYFNIEKIQYLCKMLDS